MNEIEFIQSMNVLELKENDVLFIKVGTKLSSEHLERIQEKVEQQLPENLKGKIAVFILGEGMDAGVIRKEAA